MKSNAIIRIVCYSLAIVLLGGILLGVMTFGMYIADGRAHIIEDHTVEEPIEALKQDQISTDIRYIEIEWAAGSITITEDASVHDIHITEYAPSHSKYQTVIKQSGQTLKIKFSEDSVKFSGFGTNIDFSKDLEIVVPAGWSCNSIEIDAASADVEIRNLRINKLDFDGASGLLNLDNCEIGKLDVDTASGDVEFSGTLNELDFDAASAKFSGEFFQCPDQLNLDAMSGDLEIILPDYCFFTCELDTMSGSFDTDFAITQNKNGLYIFGSKDNACHIKISAMSSDISILKGISDPAENCNH